MDVRKFDVILIGNGPSAWAALHAVPKNLSVLNIDIGNTESAKTLKIIDRANKLSQIPINKTRIDNFIKEHSDAKEVKWSVDSEYSRHENQLIPSENHDGFFYVLLEKN